MLKKNDTLTLDITELNSLGFGVARHGGMVVFVSGAVRGDTVEARVIRVTKSYAVARTERVLSASPDRREDFCPAKGCGGCAFRLLDDRVEAIEKKNGVLACMKHENLSHVTVRDTVVGERRLHYRNKAQFPAAKKKDGSLYFGFFAPKSHRVIECPHCALQSPCFASILDTLAPLLTACGVSAYDEETHTGLLRHVYMRAAENGEVLLTLVLNGKALPREQEIVQTLRAKHPEIIGILVNVQTAKTNVVCGDEYRLLWGREYLTDTLAGVTLDIPSASFYQVNHEMTEKLYAEAHRLAALTGKETVLDLYCGVGSIGLSMARDAREVIGIEIVPSAIEYARRNAEKNGIDNARFFCADAFDTHKIMDRLSHERGKAVRADVVILDPPRKGCDSALLDYIAKSLSPDSIVYVSCNPATLARDMKVLDALGYTGDTVTPFDLFPRTAHVESVVALTRRLDNELRERMN